MTVQSLKKITAIILVMAIGLLFIGCEEEEIPYSPQSPQPQESTQQQPSEGEQSPQNDQSQEDTSTEWYK